MGLHGLLSSPLNPLPSVIGRDRIKPRLSLIIRALLSLLCLMGTTAAALICPSAFLSPSLVCTDEEQHMDGRTDGDGQLVTVSRKTNYTIKLGPFVGTVRIRSV